jgi:CBS-domain-containing membrane protein
MAQHQVRRLAVLNHAHRLVGIMALADLGCAASDAVASALEAITEPTDEARR